jgi:hypothetical protein
VTQGDRIQPVRSKLALPPQDCGQTIMRVEWNPAVLFVLGYVSWNTDPVGVPIASLPISVMLVASCQPSAASVIASSTTTPSVKRESSRQKERFSNAVRIVGE